MPFEKVLPIREQLRGIDPRDARAQFNLANSHASIGYVLLEMGNARAAQSALRAAAQDRR